MVNITVKVATVKSQLKNKIEIYYNAEGEEMKITREYGTQFDPTKLVTSHEIFSKKSQTINENGTIVEQKKFNDQGLFSKRIFGDMDSKEEYSCECGKLHGKFYEGHICPKCGTAVESVGLNINKCGWIDLSMSKYNEDGVLIEKGNGYHIIKYIAYSQLEKVVGRENLRNIIHAFNTITIKGDIDDTERQNIRDSDPEYKYWYEGLEGFYQKYNEILEYYFNLHEPNNETTKGFYEYLKNRDEVFTDIIPVISIILRPAMRTAEGLKLDDINIKYQNILKNLEILKDSTLIPIIRDSTIEQIQAEYMLLSEEILDAIKSKAGIIRNQICGTRINFSARNIISPAKAGIKIDEMVIPYLTFLEMYKFELINIIKNTENITFKQAEKVWYKATLKFDEKMHKIMTKMINDNEIGVILNRNPTIAYGSMLYLRIKKVKANYDDATMSIHNNILTCLAGDYDGDVLNLISIKDKTMRELFKNVFSPVHLVIDPNNGQFNNSLNLERDQILGINSLLE
jgi:DNA-directed RNA polymerase beta' subunit